MIYFWTEDREGKSGYQFWKTFLDVLYPEIVLESKTNSSELVKSVAKINSDDTYIIALDHSFDNDQSIREVSTLRKALQKKRNVYELNIISFEFVLLSFPMLIEWIYAENDEFRNTRSRFISIREKLLEAIRKEKDYKDFPEILEWLHKIDEYNIEQITSKLLFELTRNTGFVVNKSKIGDCWKTDCCNFKDRVEDDKCGLDISRLLLSEKMLTIMNLTLLKDEFKNMGFEVKL